MPTYEESSVNKKDLDKLIKTNKFIKNSKVSSLWCSLAYILARGEFTLLSKFRDEVLALQYSSSIRFEEYLGLDKLKVNKTISQAINANEGRYFHFV